MMFRQSRYSKKALLFLLILIISTLIGAVVESTDLPAGTPVITAIDVKAVDDLTEIQIDSSSQISYTIYKPDDPYRVVVELQDISLGKFTDKMVIDKAGVAEIIPTRVEGATNTVRLEIVLAVPVSVKPLQKGKALILTFYNPEAEEEVALASEEKTALPEEEAEEALNDATVINNIKLSPSDSKVNVVITGDGRMTPKVFEIGDDKLVLDIPGVAPIIDSINAYEPPVQRIRVGKLPDRARIVFDFAAQTKYDLSTEGKQITVSFEKPEVLKAEEIDQAVPSVTQQSSVETATKTAKPFTSKEYVGERISLDFQDAELLHIFRLIADVSGYNIVVSPDVKGKFSMKLIDVPWDQALDIILRNYGLSRAVDGNIIRIAPTEVIAKEEDAIAQVKEASMKAGDLETRTYKINYADVKAMESVIKTAKINTSRGFISIDERTSTVIIKDVAGVHDEIANLIKNIDTPTQQVNIEAKIVEVTTSFTRDLGIQWGVLWRPGDSRMRIGGPSIPGGTGFNSSNPLMVNLPAAVGSGSGGAIGIGYISASNVFTLDMQLSAMEATGKGKIISNPRITTSDNQEATIQQGKSIPYQTVSADGTKTEFVDANLELTVTPHITPDGTIVMSVSAKKNEADFAQSVGGVPTIDTKEAKTKVLVNNGDTLVIGGIFKNTTSKSVAAVPGLSKIPILGLLFKKEKNIDDTSELLIFITPRIVKEN